MFTCEICKNGMTVNVRFCGDCSKQIERRFKKLQRAAMVQAEMDIKLKHAEKEYLERLKN